jgi:hypothetical protein
MTTGRLVSGEIPATALLHQDYFSGCTALIQINADD